jgi:MinD-like ATPase involved in chromosome partitioning or flagellar assembly
VLNYFGLALGSGSQEPPEEPRRPESDTGEDSGDGFAQERIYETEGEEQRDNDAWFARLRASSGETPVGLTSKSAYSVGDTAAMSRGELADAVAERRASSPDEEETSAARRLRGRTQGIRVAKDLEERRTERVRERGPKELPTSRAQGQGLPGTGEETERPRRQGRPHAAPWELGEKKADPAGGYGDLSDYAVRYAAATGRSPAEAAAVPWLPPSSAAPEEGASATGERDGDEPARADGREDAQDTGADAEDTVSTAGAHGSRDSDGTADTGRPVDRTEQDTAAAAEGDAPAQAPSRPSSRDADAPGRATASGPAGGRPSVAPRRSTAGNGDAAERRKTTASEDTAGNGDAFEDPGTAGHGSTAAPEAAPERTAPGGADTVAQDTHTQDGGTATQDGTATTDSGAPAAPAAERPARKPALELDHGTGEQDAIPGKPYEEPEDRGSEWNEHMSVLDNHLITADTPAPPRPKFADAVPTQERDDKDPSRWFEDGKKRHPDQPKVGDRGNPVIPADELREEGGAEDGADEAARRTEPLGQAPADEPKPPTQLDHGTGELVSFVEVRDDRGRGDSNVRADAGTDQARRRTVSDLERAEAEALARRRRSAGGPGDAQASGAASDPAATPAGADRGDASLRARWSMRATGTADSTGRDTDAPAAPASTAEPGREPSGTGAVRDASGEQESRTGAARDPRANPSMADALAKERTAPPNGPDTEPAAQFGDEAPANGSSRSAGQEHPAEEPQESGDPNDGVFHRVAQNARRLGQLFGQPVPGEEPDPPARETRSALELDHGTGEQERLGDTPNGVPAHRREEPEPRRRVEEPAASDSGGTRGWRRLAKVVTGGSAPVRSDLPPSDIERLRTPLDGPRSLVVLGCTGGAGQTVTALMIGHTLAAHRDDLVVAVDVNPGPNGLSRRVGAQTPETLTGLLANAEAIQDYARMSGYTSRTATGLEVVQTLDDPYVQTLDDRDYGQLASLLGGFYGVTLLDPAATGVARALPVADGLVLVAPANADAERAVSMTFDWLDGNGYGALRARSVLVVNGVSKRSLQDVDAAERVARGRCRAIVRIPWDDHLGSSYTKIDVGALRPATKRAHGALGGVLVNSLTQH